MCLLMREALTVGKIALSDHFFSVELTKQEAKSRIEDELGSYCVVVEQAKTTFGKVRSRFHQQGSAWLRNGRVLTTEFVCGWQVRKTYTGKLYGKQDDLCIAMQLAMIGQQKFFQDSKYRNFRSAQATLIGVRCAALAAPLKVRARARRGYLTRLTRFCTQALTTSRLTAYFAELAAAGATLPRVYEFLEKQKNARLGKRDHGTF